MPFAADLVGFSRERGDFGRAADRDADRALWGGRDPIIKADWMDRLPEFFSNLEPPSRPTLATSCRWSSRSVPRRKSSGFSGV